MDPTLTVHRIVFRDIRHYSSVVPHSEPFKSGHKGSSDFCRVPRRLSPLREHLQNIGKAIRIVSTIFISRVEYLHISRVGDLHETWLENNLSASYNSDDLRDEKPALTRTAMSGTFMRLSGACAQARDFRRKCARESSTEDPLRLEKH